MDYESIRLKWIENVVNPHICRCKIRTIPLNELEILLKNKEDDISKCMLFCKYLNDGTNDADANRYIAEALDNECIYALNPYGCILNVKNDDKCVDFYIEAIKNGICTAYRNLGIYYFSRNREFAKKYLKDGIDKNILCCKTFYAEYFLKDDQNYYDLMYEYANAGCIRAFEIIEDSKKYADETLMKIAKKYSFHNFICKIIDNAEKNNRYIFLKLMKEFENCDDDIISFHVAKKYFNNNSRNQGYKTLSRSIERGSESAFRFLLENIPQKFISNDLKNILFRKSSTAKLEDLQKANMVCLCYLKKDTEKQNEYMNSISTECFKLIAKYLIFHSENKIEDAFDCLQKAYDICQEEEKESFVGRLGHYHYYYGDKNKGIEILLNGIEKYKSIDCHHTLIEIYLFSNLLDAAIPHIIELYNIKRMDQVLINKLRTIKFSLDQLELLINSNVTFAILTLFEQSLDENSVKTICKNFLHVEDECSICYENKNMLKLYCGHKFCVDCLSKDHKKCFICRDSINEFLKKT